MNKIIAWSPLKTEDPIIYQLMICILQILGTTFIKKNRPISCSKSSLSHKVLSFVSENRNDQVNLHTGKLKRYKCNI